MTRYLQNAAAAVAAVLLALGTIVPVATLPPIRVATATTLPVLA